MRTGGKCHGPLADEGVVEAAEAIGGEEMGLSGVVWHGALERHLSIKTEGR